MSGLFGAFSSERSVSLAKVQGLTWYFPFKRLVDLLFSAALLFIFSPLMLVIAVLIKTDSSGPVLFRQRRIGSCRVFRDGAWVWEVKEFTCLKFRTMFHNANPEIHKAYVTALIHHDTQKMDKIQEGRQEINKLIHDPRITQVGAFLRKSSMDELPQFINVLKGEMSIVGPRPAIGYEVEQYEAWHRGRLKAQPGITGLQQVKARCITSFDEQVKYDLEYIEKQSIWLDFKIMVLTPFVVMRHRGAF